jgi:hypothetical protein
MACPPDLGSFPATPKPRSPATTGRPCTQNSAPRSTWRTCAPRSAGRARPIEASAASPARPLLNPRAGHAKAMWRHRTTPLKPEAPRKYWSTNDILRTTIKERRADSRCIIKMTQTCTFEGVRGRRLNCTTNGNGKAQWQPHQAMN